MMAQFDQIKHPLSKARELFLIFAFLVTAVHSICAQTLPGTLKIEGRIIDSANSKPMDLATVALKKESGEAIRSVLTKSDGTFLFDKLVAGSYRVVIASIGYNNKTITIELKEVAVNLGSIVLSARTTSLKEVVVTADRPIIRQEVDRIVYDIQADPENKINTVLDMMRKVPLLSVDGEDNITLNGNSNYRILINGKPSGMVARSPRDILKSMPASSIQKIEVITTPPAKYDSEGLAGLINIITNRKIDNGYKGSINTRMSFPVGGPGIGSSFTAKSGKIGASGYFGRSNYDQLTTPTSNNRLTSSAQPTSLRQNGTRHGFSKNWYFGTELSFELDSLNLLTGVFGYWGGSFKAEEQRISALTNTANTLIQGYQIDSENENDWTGTDMGLNYQKGFRRNREQLLTFSYKFTNSGDDQFNTLFLTNRVNYNMPDYIQINDGGSKEQTIQLDYVHPFKKLNIEAGVKGIIRNNESDFQSNYKQPGGAYLPDPSQSDTFDNRQIVLGAYNSYQYNGRNWGMKAGVRIEETIIDANFISSATKVDESYFNIIPTLSVNRKFKDMSSINLGYTQRIQRPNIYNLNPFVTRPNPNFEYTGNPELVPVISNNIELRYSKSKKGSFNIGLSFAYANNLIQQVSVFDPQTEITRSSLQNIGKDRTIGSNFSINYPITPKWNINLSGNLGYLWIQGMVNGRLEKNKGIRANAYSGTSYKFDKGWTLNGNFSYSSPYIMLQGRSNSWPYCSFSVNKDIIKDKLSFSAATNNPFGKYRDYKSETSGVNFTQMSSLRNYWRGYNMSLNFRFGKLQSEIKKNSRGINNDDGGGRSTN